MAKEFPNVVYRRNVDRAFGKRASNEQVLAAIVYLRDSGLINYYQARTKEYYYSLTAAGWRKAFANNDHLKSLCGHILDSLAGRYPHHVYESRLLGSLQDLNLLFHAGDYAKAIGYLELAGLVKRREGEASVGGSNIEWKLTPYGCDVQRIDCDKTDDGVILGGDKAKK